MVRFVLLCRGSSLMFAVFFVCFGSLAPRRRLVLVVASWWRLVFDRSFVVRGQRVYKS